MTDHNNSSTGDSTGAAGSSGGSGDDWEAFLSEHQHELHDIEHSKTARKFNKHAERQEKQTLVSVHDLTSDAFVGGGGPRDYRSSWLDTDDVMDQYGAGFTPPNPDLSNIKRSRLVFGLIFVIGIVGIIATVFIPHMASVLGVVFALCILVGAGGLLAQHKGHDETKRDEFDDGARV